MYRITDGGRHELARKKREWETFQRNVNRVLQVQPEGA